MSDPLAKLRGQIGPALALAGLDPDAADLVRDAADPAAALAVLEREQRIDAALKLCAFSLPRREAVWWACMCAAFTEGPDATAEEIEARETAQNWVRRVDETTRRASRQAADRAGFRSPHAWAAVAAFWSSGSMAPPGQPEVPAPAHLAGTAVHGAVALAAVRERPERRAPRSQRFLAAARDIAGGGPGQLGREPP